MKTNPSDFLRIGRPALRAGLLCLAVLLSACGGDDNAPPPADGNGNGGNGGSAPAACATARCAPAP